MSILKKILSMFKPEEPGSTSLAGPGRNEACWCGSGKKYKKCHLEEDQEKIRQQSRACCSSKG
ncbi:MAG: SEC-C metal-binding domain-containing protein [Nitrospirota bacterium]